MKVEFRRTGERRYAVTVFREGRPPITMDPAPGFDPVMPHDLVHLVVEREIGLAGGIYGQIAAGGNAGTFRPVVAEGQNQREAARLRRRESRRGDDLLRRDRDQAVLSERAVHFCLEEWLARSAGRPSARSASPAPIDPRTLDRVCQSLDETSRRWQALNIGGSLTLQWP